MPVRIANIRLGLDEPESALREHAARILGARASDLPRCRILRKSLDARDKDNLQFVYSVAVEPADERSVLAHVDRLVGREHHVELYADPPFSMLPSGSRPLSERPVVVGSGPGGLAAAYFLAQYGYRPILVERGRPVRERIHDVHAFDRGGPLDPESNYLFGEGGAGTFSDGKLTCRGAGPDIRRILELFAENKGKPSVVYEQRPHLGSNRLPAVVKALRRRIEQLGGEVRFSCRVEDLDIFDGRLRGVATSSGYLPASIAIVAIGHSARDTYAMLLRRGVPLVPKPFQMGVRIEQPQENVNRFQYGPTRLEERLGAADYSLIAHGRNDLFTFCMCAGGSIIPSVSTSGYFCTNGMSLSGRASPFANSGLVVTIAPEDFGSADPLAGVRLQEVYEHRAYEIGRGEYLCPIQTVADFLAGRAGSRLPPCSYPRGLVASSMNEIVPPPVVEALRHGLPIMDRRWQGRFLSDANLVGPEARGSSPVRIVRDEPSRETPGVEGIYPVGEGAGYAGGIVSAAVDGLRSARAIIAKYAPLEKKEVPR